MKEKRVPGLDGAVHCPPRACDFNASTKMSKQTSLWVFDLQDGLYDGGQEDMRRVDDRHG